MKKQRFNCQDKQRNIEMFLNEIKINPLDISTSICAYNEIILTQDRINLLMHNAYEYGI